MPREQRLQKINEEILRELSGLIARLKDPRLGGLISVTRVDTSRDLSVARVYVSVLTGETPADQVVKVLQTASAHLRHELAHALTLRHTPALRFVADVSIVRGAGVQKIMQELFPQDTDTDTDAPEGAGDKDNTEE